jgi:hypothetical protein
MGLGTVTNKIPQNNYFCAICTQGYSGLYLSKEVLVYFMLLSLKNGALKIKLGFIKYEVNWLSTHFKEISQKEIDRSVPRWKKIYIHLNVRGFNSKKQVTWRLEKKILAWKALKWGLVLKLNYCFGWSYSTHAWFSCILIITLSNYNQIIISLFQFRL